MRFQCLMTCRVWYMRSRFAAQRNNCIILEYFGIFVGCIHFYLMFRVTWKCNYINLPIESIRNKFEDLLPAYQLHHVEIAKKFYPGPNKIHKHREVHGFVLVKPWVWHRPKCSAAVHRFSALGFLVTSLRSSIWDGFFWGVPTAWRTTFTMLNNENCPTCCSPQR